MNEQIRTLALQAGINKMNQRSDGFFVVDEKVFEKFAELIVKECAHIAEVNQAENMGWNIGEIIKEHFGVKE